MYQTKLSAEMRRAVTVEAVIALAAKTNPADITTAQIAVTGATPVDRLRAIFTTHIEFVVEHVGIPRILFGELQRDSNAPGKARVRALMTGYRERVINLLDQAKTQGLIKETIDCTAAATMFLGMVQGLAMQAMAADDFDNMLAVSVRLFDLFLDALGAAT